MYLCFSKKYHKNPLIKIFKIPSHLFFQQKTVSLRIFLKKQKIKNQQNKKPLVRFKNYD